ncbi:MAG TPA: hypothetical protein VKZ50_15370 [bacterium]|nr:hypothetical protein [bacterium]
MIYLVRCAECDQAFWLDVRDARTPAHNRWDRRASALPAAERGDGSGRTGHWVMESLRPLPAITRPDQPWTRRSDGF